jgi:hypothetical protein
LPISIPLLVGGAGNYSEFCALKRERHPETGQNWKERHSYGTFILITYIYILSLFLLGFMRGVNMYEAIVGCAITRAGFGWFLRKCDSVFA